MAETGSKVAWLDISLIKAGIVALAVPAFCRLVIEIADVAGKVASSTLFREQAFKGRFEPDHL